MTKTQYTYIERKHAESGQTGTATYDLPERGFIPELIVTAFATPTTSTNPPLPLSDAITKIEVADGGKTIKSLTGNQIKALSMIHKYPNLGSSEKNDNTVENYDQFLIQMGAILDGQAYAPDMSVFSNPQIKITWDYSDTTTEFGMTCDAVTTPAMKFSILANILRESGIYNHGYVKSTNLREYTQATSTTNITELPRNHQLVGVGIEAGYDALDFTEDVEEIKLDFDNEDWVPFNLKEEEVAAIQQVWFKKPFTYHFMTDLEDADEFDSHMGYLLHLSATPTIDSSNGLVFRFDGNHKGVETVDLMDLATPTACSVYQQLAMTSVGYCPFHMWYCPTRAITGGESDLLDTKPFGRIELEVLSGSSASTSSTPNVIGEFLVQ